MKPRLRHVAVATLLASPVGFATTGDAAQRRTLIAYTVRGSHAEVYTIGADGSGRRRLTGTPPYLTNRPSSFDPMWSPDGRSIAFVRAEPRSGEQIGPARLFVMNADGTDHRPLTPAGRLGQPAWSPDGRRIAFTREEPPRDKDSAGGTSIRIVNADDGGEVQVTQASSGIAFDSSPDWSPDGSRIAFSHVAVDSDGRLTEAGIYTVAPDGSGQSKLVADADSPAWSPDGQRIAFITARDAYGETCFEDCNPNGEVYVADADGSNVTRVTRTTASETAPAWSPDGRRIAFTSDRNAPGNGSEIYSVGVDGTCMTWLTNGPLQSGAPAWEPGSGLDSDPGGCAAVRRKPTTGDLKPARPRMPFPAYWVGSDFRHQLLTNVGELLAGSKIVDLHYDDCGVYEPARCSGSIELQNASICARHPLSFGGREPVPGGQVLATARFKRRGVLAAYFPSAGGWDIYTGSTTVTVFGASRADVKGIVDALRPIGGGNRRLPAPAFPAREFWAKLDAVIRMYRQLGSVSAVALRLEIEERTVEDRLAWARLLAGYHRPSRHRCTAAERGRQLGPAPQY